MAGGVKDLQPGSLNYCMKYFRAVFIIKHCHVDTKKDLISSLKQSKKVLRHNHLENKSL